MKRLFPLLGLLLLATPASATITLVNSAGKASATSSSVTSTAIGGGSTTDQGSTTTTFNIGGAWTLGGTGTKTPVHIHGRIEGASASGTVVSLQLVAPTVGDLVTIYRGAACWVHQ